jgi:hypothetical protein
MSWPLTRSSDVVDLSGAAAAVAGAGLKERPDAMVAATRPAAPMDLRAVDALFL